MVHASVVIPTKNAMPRFARVLEVVLQQDTPWPYEVVIIDSGSRDGTLEYVQAQDCARTISIDPRTFGHGKTRNQAIAAAQGKFVALLTQDAQPADRNWLASLVAAVEQDENIAGAFGRHIGYPDASPFTKRDLEEHFSGFLQHPLVVRKDLDPAKYERDVGWRQFLHFYSDNNSCLRRSVWEKIPYPDVEFAEDQLWAQQIIEAGYGKAYAPDAAVYHSHDFYLWERLQRSFDEAKHFRSQFGYRLCPTVRDWARSVLGLSYRDWKYADESEEISRNSLVRLRRPLENLMTVTGHFLGTHYERIPRTLQMGLSRDKQLQAMR